MSTERKDIVVVTPVNFLTLQSAIVKGNGEQDYLVLSFESGEGQIEQIGFRHSDAQSLLGELLKGLVSQGSATAKLLLDTLEEAYGEQENNEESTGDNEFSNPDEAEDDEEEIDFIDDSGDSDDFGPEQ